VDDWLDLGLVVDVARRRESLPDEALTALAIGLVAIVLSERLMKPGSVKEGSFESWEAGPGEALDRIVREWLSIGTPNLRPGDVAWLCNTDVGDARGRAVLEREAASE
jgi:hypothetical protein